MLIQNHPSEHLLNTSVLMYHGISKMGGYGTIGSDDFTRQIKLLSRNYRFIGLDELGKSSVENKQHLLLTFDDGYHNNFLHSVPILRELKIPAVFFVSHRHCQQGAYLWFSYLKGLDAYYREPIITWRGIAYNLQGKQRKISLQKIRANLLSLSPHPSEMYKVISQEFPPLESFIAPEDISEYFSGISIEELRLIADDGLFSLGLHTTDHAFLTRCSREEARNQLLDNIKFLSQVTACRPTAIAYPSGDYNERIMELCLDLNIPFGFSVSPNRKSWNNQDIPRIGVYSSSLLKMIIKVSTGKRLRSLGIKIG